MKGGPGTPQGSLSPWRPGQEGGGAFPAGGGGGCQGPAPQTLWPKGDVPALGIPLSQTPVETWPNPERPHPVSSAPQAFVLSSRGSGFWKRLNEGLVLPWWPHWRREHLEDEKLAVSLCHQWRGLEGTASCGSLHPLSSAAPLSLQLGPGFCGLPCPAVAPQGLRAGQSPDEALQPCPACVLPKATPLLSQLPFLPFLSSPADPGRRPEGGQSPARLNLWKGGWVGSAPRPRRRPPRTCSDT